MWRDPQSYKNLGQSFLDSRQSAVCGQTRRARGNRNHAGMHRCPRRLSAHGKIWAPSMLRKSMWSSSRRARSTCPSQLQVLLLFQICPGAWFQIWEGQAGFETTCNWYWRGPLSASPCPTERHS
eukprot:1140325-Pelagomonas_calceolata.AAC.2